MEIKIIKDNQAAIKRLKKYGDFSNQIDMYKRNELPSNEILYLGSTPIVLKKLGIKDNPITIRQSALKHIIKEGKKNGHNHGISIEAVKRIPEAIKNPLNVLYSNNSTKGDSVVIITDMADKDERPIIVSVLLDSKGQIGNIEFVTNDLTSAYGKKDYDNYMQEQIKKGNMLYDIDEGIKKELALSRVQFPESPNS